LKNTQQLGAVVRELQSSVDEDEEKEDRPKRLAGRNSSAAQAEEVKRFPPEKLGPQQGC
jgi:hypothetical protein